MSHTAPGNIAILGSYTRTGEESHHANTLSHFDLVNPGTNFPERLDPSLGNGTFDAVFICFEDGRLTTPHTHAAIKAAEDIRENDARIPIICVFQETNESLRLILTHRLGPYFSIMEPSAGGLISKDDVEIFLHGQGGALAQSAYRILQMQAFRKNSDELTRQLTKKPRDEEPSWDYEKRLLRLNGKDIVLGSCGAELFDILITHRWAGNRFLLQETQQLGLPSSNRVDRIGDLVRNISRKAEEALGKDMPEGGFIQTLWGFGRKLNPAIAIKIVDKPMRPPRLYHLFQDEPPKPKSGPRGPMA